MKLFEVAVQYHKDLCPKLWDGKQLKPEVKDKLLEIAESFIEYLDTPFDPEDIAITGSIANYNWTDASDVDLHLITSIEEYRQACPDFAEDFFNNKKTLWNEHHEIEIYGHPVEVYVQDSGEEHHSTGVYSVLHDQWVVEPEYDPPEDVDTQLIKADAQKFKDKIDKITGSNGNSEAANDLKDEIREYRQEGLDSDDSEFSVQNLVFKELRRSGHMGKLVDYIRDDKADQLSL